MQSVEIQWPAADLWCKKVYCNILVTTWPITLKLRMHLGTHPAMHLYVSQLGCDCTCARARRAMFHVHVQCSRSRKRLDQLRSNLVYWWVSVSRVAYKSKLGPNLHVRTCRATVPDLKNGWTDCAQIWYTVRDRLVGGRAQVNWRYPGAISHVQGSLSRSLRWSPQKALYWFKYFMIIRSVTQRARSYFGE